MKRYCVDTSGLSNPLETMPEDIFSSLWANIYGLIEDGIFAVTPEIYEELILIDGNISEAIKNNKDSIILDIGGNDWDWEAYVQHSNAMNITHHDFISEYSGGSPKTVGLNDMTIIALAKTLQLPLISMESFATNSLTKKRIPDICRLEDIEHLTFNDFLRAEGISI